VLETSGGFGKPAREFVRNDLRPIEVGDHDEIKAKVKLRATQWLTIAMTAVVHRNVGFSRKTPPFHHCRYTLPMPTA